MGTTTTPTHTMPSSTSDTTATIKMQKPKAMMVGGRRARRAAPTKSKAASKVKASSSTSSPSSPAPLVGIASFLDSFLNPDGGILMEAPATPEDTDSQVYDAPRRRTKAPKQQKIKNMGNRSSRGKGNISQPRSTGGNH